jgi:hypothetical protein
MDDKKGSETITVLLVEPEKAPRMVTIEHTLKAITDTVGGFFEAYMPDTDPVAIVCSCDGKESGAPLNRVIYTKADPETGKREPLDYIAGPFFICYAPPGSNVMLSLPDDLAKKYEEIFRYPDFAAVDANGEAVIVSRFGGNENLQRTAEAGNG